MVLLGALLGVIVSLSITLATTPMYRSSTSLEIQAIHQVQSGANEITSMDPDVATQVQLLSSGTLRNRALAKVREKPMQFPKTEDPLGAIRWLLHLQEPGKSVEWNTAVSQAAGSARITAGNNNNRILFIETRSAHPQAAADFTNALVTEYLAQKQELRWSSYQNTNEWLSRAQEELKKKVEDSERRLQDFAQAHGLIITGQQNITEESLKQLQTQMAQASADRIAKKSTYDSSLSSPTESLPSVLDSGPMAHYQVQLSDLNRQLADLSATLTPDHYKVKKLQAQIKETESARDKERQNIMSRIKIDYEASQKREAQLEKAFKDQAQVLSGQARELIQYNILSREAESNKKLYEQTLAQGKEAGIASAMSASTARVVDQAAPSLSPQSPNVLLNFALGMAGGLFCGTAFVIVRSTIDNRIQDPGTLQFHLKLRELGIIPSATSVPGIRSFRLLPASDGRPKHPRKKAHKQVIIPKDPLPQPAESLELITWTRKSSVMAEAFRATLTSILFSAENEPRVQALVITSPSKGEGKTTVTTNLAIALAEINHRVVLIDADMRLPRLHSIFDLPNTSGLSDLLHERRPFEEYSDEELARKTHIPNLYVMPAGPARSNLARLLYSHRANELLMRLRGSFDMILLDSPPVMHVPDARVLARVADAVVLVMRAHHTSQMSALAAVRCFEQDGRVLLGTILNDWDPKRSNYGSYGAYGPYGA